MIIFLQQVPAATGTVAGSSRHAVVATLQGIATLTWSAAARPLVTVVLVAALMILAPRVSRRVPGSLVAIVVVTILASLAHLPMAHIGRLPSSLPRPSLPTLARALAAPILTVAALAAIESLLSARVGRIDLRHHRVRHHRPGDVVVRPHHRGRHRGPWPGSSPSRTVPLSRRAPRGASGAPSPGRRPIALFRLDGALFFGAAERILDRVNEIEGVHVVILRMSQLQDLNATGARVITEMIRSLEQRGVTVLVKGIQPDHRRLVTRVGVLESLRHHNHLFADLPQAVEHARSHVVRQSHAFSSSTDQPDNPTSSSAQSRFRCCVTDWWQCAADVD